MREIYKDKIVICKWLKSVGRKLLAVFYAATHPCSCSLQTRPFRRTHLDLDLIKGLSVVNANQRADHLGENDRITQVSANRIGLLSWRRILFLQSCESSTQHGFLLEIHNTLGRGRAGVYKWADGWNAQLCAGGSPDQHASGGCFSGAACTDTHSLHLSCFRWNDRHRASCVGQSRLWARPQLTWAYLRRARA